MQEPTFRKRQTHTDLIRSAVDKDTATAVYTFLRDNITWAEGVKSRRTGFTRKQCSLDVTTYPSIVELVGLTLSKFDQFKGKHILCWQIYLNYYQDGTMYTPTHSHEGTDQLIISLGASRKLKVGTTTYTLNNGDAIIFGSSKHNVPKEPLIKEGRISIAAFCRIISPRCNRFPDPSISKGKTTIDFMTN